MSAMPQSIPFFLDANKKVLEKMNRILYDRFCLDPSMPETINLVRTKTGKLTIKYQNILLHSVYDPEEEARRFIEAQNIEKGNIVIVYGLGLAYHIQEILARIGQEGKIFVIEPNLDILKAAFLLVDMRPFLDDPRCYIISGVDEESVALRFSSAVNKELYNVGDEVKNIVIHAPSFKCLPDGYSNLANIFEMLLLERRAPEVFEKINYVNIKANLDAILESPGMRQFEGRFKGLPAFFVNAGPSLDAAIPFLKEYTDKAIFFCSDTALPALVQNAIIPDFVLTVDPQEKSKTHFKDCYACGARLIFTPTSAHTIVRNYNGQKSVVLQRNHSITRRFENVLSLKGFTEAGSSVSCMGLDLLLRMECSPIVFVGMDYSFPGGKMYSSYSYAINRWYSECWKLNPMETIHFNAIHGDKVITIKNKYGEDIPTYQNLLAYLKHIEALVQEHPDTEFYNFASHGAHIEGVEDLFLSEELALLMKQRINKDMHVEKESFDKEVKRVIMHALTIE
jgi:hypothetical protein